MLIYTYLILQFIFYILLHTTNIFDYDIGCYSVIIAGVILSLIFTIKLKNKLYYLIFLAQIFTLIADTFLVIVDDYYIVAMFSFCFVQLFYYLYILLSTNQKDKYHKIFLYIRLISIILLSIISVIVVEFDLLVIVSLVYFSQLFFNTIESLFTFKQNPFLSIGLFLFMLCDICVGFYNLVDIFDIASTSIIYKIAYAKVDLVWIFYHPSQVILSLTAFLNQKTLTEE